MSFTFCDEPTVERQEPVLSQPCAVTDSPPHETSMNISEPTLLSLSVPKVNKDHNLLNTWVVVEYDSTPYVGKVISQDNESVEVQELLQVGQNKFVMPDNEDMTLWYEYEKILGIIQTPLRQTRRVLSIDNESWNMHFK